MHLSTVFYTPEWCLERGLDLAWYDVGYNLNHTPRAIHRRIYGVILVTASWPLPIRLLRQTNALFVGYELEQPACRFGANDDFESLRMIYKSWCVEITTDNRMLSGMA